MDVLHIIPVFYPAFKSGGPATAVFIMNKAIIERGVKVDVMTTNFLLEERNDIKMNEWVNVEGMRIKYFPSYLKESYTFSPQLFWEVLKEIKNYDLVHITLFWNFHALTGSLASVIYKKPYIISPGGALYEEAVNIKSKYLKKIYFYLVAKHYLNKASAIHYTTEDEKNNTANFLDVSNKSFVIPNGIDLNKFEHLPPKGLFKNKHPILKGKKYILFLGRIHVKKGIDILVEAFQKLVKIYDDLFLVIAGPDNDHYTDEIRKQLKCYSLQDKVLFPGILLNRDKISAYVDAEMFVLSSYSENFANTVVEAMACNTPVVISTKVGISRTIEENDAGIVVELNPESTFRGMKTLLDNPQLCNEIRVNARELTQKKYDVKMVADMMIKAYEEVLKDVKN